MSFNAGLMFWKIAAVVAVFFLLLLGKSWLGVQADNRERQTRQKPKCRTDCGF